MPYENCLSLYMTGAVWYSDVFFCAMEKSNDIKCLGSRCLYVGLLYLHSFLKQFLGIFCSTNTYIHEKPITWKKRGFSVSD